MCISRLEGASTTPTACIIQNLINVFGSNSQPGVQKAYGVDYSAYGSSNYANNDLHEFINCDSYNHSQAAFYIKGTQAHQIVYRGCRAVDYNNRNPKGVWCEESGYFRFESGGLGNNSWDFYVGGPTTRIEVINFNSEHSQKLFYSDRADGKKNVVFKGFRVEMDPLGTAEDPEAVVDGFGYGPFAFEDGLISGLNGVPPVFRFTSNVPVSSRIGQVVRITDVEFREYAEEFADVDQIRFPSGFTHFNRGGSRTLVNGEERAYRGLRVKKVL